MRIFAVLSLIGVLTSTAVATAETWPVAQTESFTADWSAARAALPAIQDAGPQTDALAVATASASKRFPAIADSPVPVLLPLSPVEATDRRAEDVNRVENDSAGFEPTKFLYVGPTGYDATFVFRTGDVSGFNDILFRDPVVVQISAFTLLYQLPEAKGATIQQPGDIAKDFPGIRKQILEHTLRYSFERFGIPYVVSVQCFDGPQRRTRLACRNADRIALRFLRALRVVGGNPAASVATAAPEPIKRPETQSEAFRYYPVGKLVPGSGMRAPAGDPDRTVYARIRFPAAVAPAYVNTQTFRRRSALAIRRTPPASPGDKTDHDSQQETAVYTWRDNFCERRDFGVGQCPSGRGHQGQDILGVTCEPGPRKRDCTANRDAVVAAREGMILRESWNDSFFLVTNAQGERVRFRYLHMHPRRLDDDNIFSGRLVKEGDPLGTIGNYNRRPGMTTTHLHFELQVPTRDGYVRVNPYVTLLAAYEHLIGARGREVIQPSPGDAADASTEAGASALAVAATHPDAKIVAGSANKNQAKARHRARVRLAKMHGRKRR
ncbi:M23 family metallopeptidase [Pseudorhodoplanes sp.]|uniref:M23 family metallopeptidase n=1 Tax=Pseudorhodoplanes sp. TaxID=1934341 RepID=UPI002B9103F2|nr:M23 family metallopeptidase [Pseudorhodoplanes sp.]HWV55651.1 M23 family metallopeptidase [Pseudorhodoplanes sp.]